MRIGKRRLGDVAVVDLAGKFSVVTGPGQLKEVVSDLVFSGNRQIVLNLADVRYIDSSGLGELVACYLTAERHGSTIKLANLDGRTKDVLVLTRLLSLFESHPSEDAAVLSFSPALPEAARQSRPALRPGPTGTAFVDIGQYPQLTMPSS